MSTGTRGYPDLHEHIERLDQAGLLLKIDEPINKDTQMHPLVRWQFLGGLDEAHRKAFLFTNIVDGRGRKFEIPMVVGALAGHHGSGGLDVFAMAGAMAGLGGGFAVARRLQGRSGDYEPRMVRIVPGEALNLSTNPTVF